MRSDEEIADIDARFARRVFLEASAHSLKQFERRMDLMVNEALFDIETSVLWAKEFINSDRNYLKYYEKSISFYLGRPHCYVPPATGGRKNLIGK